MSRRRHRRQYPRHSRDSETDTGLFLLYSVDDQLNSRFYDLGTRNTQLGSQKLTLLFQNHNTSNQRLDVLVQLGDVGLLGLHLDPLRVQCKLLGHVLGCDLSKVRLLGTRRLTSTCTSWSLVLMSVKVSLSCVKRLSIVGSSFMAFDLIKFSTFELRAVSKREKSCAQKSIDIENRARWYCCCTGGFFPFFSLFYVAISAVSASVSR